MKHFLIIAFILLSANITMGAGDSYTSRTTNKQGHTNVILPKNYQVFKSNLLHIAQSEHKLPVFDFRRNTDFTMLYIAGSLLVATSSFILLNSDKNNGYLTPANTGVMIGGGLSATIIATKFLLDNTK